MSDLIPAGGEPEEPDVSLAISDPAKYDEMVYARQAYLIATDTEPAKIAARATVLNAVATSRLARATADASNQSSRYASALNTLTKGLLGVGGAGVFVAAAAEWNWF